MNRNPSRDARQLLNSRGSNKGYKDARSHLNKSSGSTFKATPIVFDAREQINTGLKSHSLKKVPPKKPFGTTGLSTISKKPHNIISLNTKKTFATKAPKKLMDESVVAIANKSLLTTKTIRNELATKPEPTSKFDKTSKSMGFVCVSGDGRRTLSNKVTLDDQGLKIAIRNDVQPQANIMNPTTSSSPPYALKKRIPGNLSSNLRISSTSFPKPLMAEPIIRKRPTPISTASAAYNEKHVWRPKASAGLLRTPQPRGGNVGPYQRPQQQPRMLMMGGGPSMQYTDDDFHEDGFMEDDQVYYNNNQPSTSSLLLLHNNNSPMPSSSGFMRQQLNDESEDLHGIHQLPPQHRFNNQHDNGSSGVSNQDILRLKMKLAEMKEEKKRQEQLQMQANNRRSYQPEPQQPTSVGTFASPFEGTKVVIENLHPRVVEEDIQELFSVIGPVKRVRMIDYDKAAVVFVRKNDAVEAINRYNNRDLDGQPMRMQLQERPADSQTGKWYSWMGEIGSRKNIQGSNSIDLETNVLQRALFRSGNNGTSMRPVVFTVKV